MDELLTGQELCELLGINYEEIIAARSCDRAENLAYFVDELLKIPGVQAEIRERIKTHEA
jgi:hypothetical protein